MFKRFVATACLFILLTGALNAAARDGKWSAPPFNDLFIFGDSLSDSGNLFFISRRTEPPSEPPSQFYFNGRFSNGPVWVESLSLLLGLEVDFDTNVSDGPLLANNQAIGGAFTGFDSESGGPFGVRSQVESFVEAGGSFDPDDLVILWAGANDYFSTNRAPATVVRDLIKAIKRLATVGAVHFLVANLPNLGDTPGGEGSGDPAGLNALTTVHNALLAKAIGKLRARRRLDIVLLDVNTTFAQILEHPEVFGFDNVGDSCLSQNPDDGTRKPTQYCPSDDNGMTFDAAGLLFWDLIHPTAAAHRQIAVVAHTTLVAIRNQRLVFGPNRR